MTSAQIEAGQHEWHRRAGGWHVAFGGVSALTGGLVAVDSDLGAGRRVLGVTLVVALVGWYVTLGAKRVSRPRTAGAWVYLGGAAVLVIAMFAVAPAGAALLFILFPQLWAMVPPRQGVAGNVAVIAAITVVIGTRLDPPSLFLPGVALPMGLTLLGSVLVGLWITRIIEQSTRRAELVAELAATRAELAEVSRAAGASAERERMARDIHDTVAQGFTSVLLLLDVLEAELTNEQVTARGYLHRARETARENLVEARTLINCATPPALVAASLPGALQQVVERVSPDLPGGATLTVAGEPRPLSADREVVVLRAGQEALANVRRHAGAHHARVHLEYCATAVTLRVSDDGRGFDSGTQPDGFGLSGMRERVLAAGGAVNLRTSPGTGVTVVVEVPA